MRGLFDNAARTKAGKKAIFIAQDYLINHKHLMVKNRKRQMGKLAKCNNVARMKRFLFHPGFKEAEVSQQRHPKN